LFFRMLASFSRLILFDRRGSGASDPVVLDSLPPWEAYVEDLEAVLDQVGSERAAIMAHVDGGAMALFVRRYQTGADQRAGAGELRCQVRGRRGLPNRNPP
jgi:pimeloyl-ACP methyl ester carboxylesterase